MSDSPPLLTDDPLWIAAPVSWREACFSLPATRALSVLRPLHVLCLDTQEGFWQAAGVGEVHLYQADAKPKALGRSLPPVKQCLLWEEGVAADAMVAAKAKVRLGLPTGGLAKRLTDPVVVTRQPGPVTHQVRLFLELAEHLGAGPFEGHHFSPLQSPIARQPGSWLIAPDSDFGSHFNWPLDRWIGLLQELPFDRQFARVLGNGPIATQLAAESGIELIAPLEPIQFGAFEHCLAADSSIPHLAAAFGVTCSVLFGPGDPERTRPLGKQHRPIRKKVECSPCLMDKCPLDLRCQQDLEVERVRQLLTLNEIA